MISREPPSGAVAPLPLWPTVAAAYRLVLGNFVALMKLATLPFVLLLLINALATLLDPLAYSLAWEFGVELPWTMMAVGWLRHLLLAPGPEGAVFFPKLCPRHLRFLGYALLLSAIGLPLTLFAYPADYLALEGTQRTVIYWVLYLLIFYLSLRFSFVYAAVALDENYSLALAWRHTRGISFTLFLAVGLAAMLPWQICSYLLSVHLQPDSVMTVIAAFLWHAGLWLLEATYLAFVAVAFRTCTGWVPAPDPRMLERFE